MTDDSRSPSPHLLFLPHLFPSQPSISFNSHLRSTYQLGGSETKSWPLDGVCCSVFDLDCLIISLFQHSSPFLINQLSRCPGVRPLFWAHCSGCCESEMYQIQRAGHRAQDSGPLTMGSGTIPNTGSVLQGPCPGATLVEATWFPQVFVFQSRIPTSCFSRHCWSLTPALRAGPGDNTLSEPP